MKFVASVWAGITVNGRTPLHVLKTDTMTFEW